MNRSQGHFLTEVAKSILSAGVGAAISWYLATGGAPPVCPIQGIVYDSATSQALGNVSVKYLAKGATDSVRLAVTGPDGHFFGDCRGLKDFPLGLELSSPHWLDQTIKTDVSIPRWGKQGINLFVPVLEARRDALRTKIISTYVPPPKP